MLCVGQQRRGSCVICLGGKRRALSKGSSIQHIQRQQILYAGGILCLQQALEHKAGVSGQKFTVGGLCLFGQVPWPAQAVKAEHGRHALILSSVAVREDGIIFCGKDFPIQKTLSVMVSLPRKGVKQDVGGAFLYVLPVGGVP